MAIGCDFSLLPEDTAYLREQFHITTKYPKTIMNNLMKEAAAKEEQQLLHLNPKTPVKMPMGCIEATSRPIDLQSAELIYEDNNRLIAERSGALFKYSEELGFWSLWPDSKVLKIAQETLQKLVVFSDKNGQWEKPHGNSNQVKSTVEQLKIITTDGALSHTELPKVIVFRNGTFDLKRKSLDHHNPAHGATYGVAAEYISDADCPDELLNIINTCYPEGTKTIIRTIIRWAVDPTIRYGEAFHIIGDSGTGKGLIIDFIRSLFPSNVIGQLLHPSDISGPEKIHQYVVGKRLVAFPDTPSILQRRDGDACNIFYELVENKPATTRKLFAGESEDSRLLNCRFIIGSIRALNFKDRDGYLRRVITLHTLPRTSAPDTRLRSSLNPESLRFDKIRAEAISWALAMPIDDVNAVLNGIDPEGLLQEASQNAAVQSDTISQWADQCLEPAASPHVPVTRIDLDDMFDCYMAWCKRDNANFTARRTNFIGQLRTILGPNRCLPRKQKRLHGQDERENLPAIDAGFKLNDDIWTHSCGIPSQGLDSKKIADGGLERISALAPANRTECQKFKPQG